VVDPGFFSVIEPTTPTTPSARPPLLSQGGEEHGPLGFHDGSIGRGRLREPSNRTICDLRFMGRVG
jgi:hypothetical protein